MVELVDCAAGQESDSAGDMSVFAEVLEGSAKVASINIRQFCEFSLTDGYQVCLDAACRHGGIDAQVGDGEGLIQEYCLWDAGEAFWFWDGHGAQPGWGGIWPRE